MFSVRHDSIRKLREVGTVRNKMAGSDNQKIRRKSRFAKV
jgi:hypothetical protein